MGAQPVRIARTARAFAAALRLAIGGGKCFRAQLRGAAPASKARPDVQAVFCIDARSERLRRALEATSPAIETIGFAGFFGFPIEFVGFGHELGGAQCPVLLTPAMRVEQTPTAGSPARALDEFRFAKRLGHGWNSFKTSAVSCFAFVESGGLLAGVKLIQDAFGVAHDEAARAEMAPQIAGEASIDARVAVAAGALKKMGLTQNLARLVMICGHGSQTANNPYGAGLDCGACGGHSGEANARVAAQIFERCKSARELEGTGHPDSRRH